MTTSRKIIKQLIAGGLSEAQIQSIRQGDKEADLLLEIINACLKKIKPKLKKYKISDDLNQDDIELLLMRLLTFNIKKRDASTFLHQLYHNDKFYDHLQPALSVAATPYPEAAENLKNITLQSEKQVFDYLVKNASRGERRRVPWFKKLWGDLLEHLPTKDGGFGLPAIAIASFLVLFLVGRVLWQNPAGTDIYKTYFASETAYASSQISLHLAANSTSRLRGGSQAIPSKEGSILQSVKTPEKLAKISSQLDIAHGFYSEKYFSNALTELEAVEPQILSLGASPAADTLTAQFHFYYGMSHLGLADKKLTYKRHARKAIDHLKAADRILALQNGKKHQEEITFFLGYAYTLMGDKKSARNCLSSISKESKFYQQSQMLISDF